MWKWQWKIIAWRRVPMCLDIVGASTQCCCWFAPALNICYLWWDVVVTYHPHFRMSMTDWLCTNLETCTICYCYLMIMTFVSSETRDAGWFSPTLPGIQHRICRSPLCWESVLWYWWILWKEPRCSLQWPYTVDADKWKVSGRSQLSAFSQVYKLYAGGRGQWPAYAFRKTKKIWFVFDKT
jgi:hypothetical protein